MSAAAKRSLAALTVLLASLWPGLALGANTTITSQVCHGIFGAVTLVSSTASPTTGTSADVSGTADPNSQIIIKVNGIPKATLMTAPNSTFAATVPIPIGDDTIVASAHDGACGHSGFSSDVLIHRDQVPPDAPQISQPVSGTVTTSTSAFVQGSAEVASDLEVMVGGVVVATLTVGGGGTFAVTVPLKLGSNTIQAHATNPAGTGPLSVPIQITRQLAPVPPPAPSPSPSPSPPPVVVGAPQITSPTTGTVTTGASVIISILGTPKAKAVVAVNGVEVATVVIASDGTAQVTVPLQLGDNLITVTIGGHSSTTVAVRRDLPGPVSPVITGPEDGSSTHSGNVIVKGTAEPGTPVDIYVGTAKAASVVADDSGAFAAQVSLKAGLNLIYAQLTGPGDTVVRSSTVQVDYVTSTTAGAEVKTGLSAIITVPIAAIILTGQAISQVIGAIASSPARVAAVMVLSFASTSAARGLLGLELFLLLPGLLRLVRARRIKGATVIRGQVTDTVTGRPINLARITAGIRQSVHAMTGRDGKFVISVLPGTDSTLQIQRPGYGTVTTHSATGDAHIDINLEPSSASHTPLETVADMVLGITTWTIILLATAVGVDLVVTHPGLGSFALAALSLALLIANITSLMTQPRYRWGRVTDRGGVPFGDVEVSLLNHSKDAVSTYRPDQSGRYTLYAHPGDYQLTVTSGDGQVLHQEGISIERRSTYLGFGLKLKRK